MERRLAAEGAQRGDEVSIGHTTFEFIPDEDIETTGDTGMATKRELTQADDRGWAVFIGTVESLDDEQLRRDRVLPRPGWSVKDLIAHIGFWMAEAANKLERIRFGTYGPARSTSSDERGVLRGEPRPARSP